MKTDLNNTLRQLKRSIKQADTGILDTNAFELLLNSIAEYAVSEGLSSAEEAANQCLALIQAGTGGNTLARKIGKLHSLIQTKKEKNAVMSKRESKARGELNKKMQQRQRRKTDLAVYDIVRVPTQGGWHHSVIVRIHRKRVECLPITTATEEQLSIIGCGYFKLKRTKNGQPLYLTSSRTVIPYDTAACCYVRPYENPAEIAEALSAFAG